MNQIVYKQLKLDQLRKKFIHIHLFSKQAKLKYKFKLDY